MKVVGVHDYMETSLLKILKYMKYSSILRETSRDQVLIFYKTRLHVNHLGERSMQLINKEIFKNSLRHLVHLQLSESFIWVEVTMSIFMFHERKMNVPELFFGFEHPLKTYH